MKCYCVNDVKCVVLKQNESEIGSDMLLVSKFYFVSIYVNANFKPDTCRKCLIDDTQI